MVFLDQQYVFMVLMDSVRSLYFPQLKCYFIVEIESNQEVPLTPRVSQAANQTAKESLNNMSPLPASH